MHVEDVYLVTKEYSHGTAVTRLSNTGQLCRGVGMMRGSTLTPTPFARAVYVSRGDCLSNGDLLGTEMSLERTSCLWNGDALRRCVRRVLDPRGAIETGRVTAKLSKTMVATVTPHLTRILTPFSENLDNLWPSGGGVCTCAARAPTFEPGIGEITSRC